MTDLLAAVDDAFAVTSRGLRQWDDPHQGEMPAEEEYSRCLDPAKWQILGARAEAWIEALVSAGIATLERDVDLAWPADLPRIRRCDLLVPVRPGTLALAVARTGDESADFGVMLGAVAAGRPPAVVCFLPDCGCDACDSGSANELALLDEMITDVVSGAFRRLTRGRSSITVCANGRGAEWPPREGIDAVLADPTGWDEISGAPWREVPGAACV